MVNNEMDGLVICERVNYVDDIGRKKMIIGFFVLNGMVGIFVDDNGIGSVKIVGDLLFLVLLL